MSYPLDTSRAGMPGLTVAAIVGEIRAVRTAMDPRNLPRGRGPMDAALDVLVSVWPGSSPDSLASDYPREDGSLDTWARAGVVHGMIDTIEARVGHRQPPTAVPMAAAVYSHLYSLATVLMGVVK